MATIANAIAYFKLDSNDKITFQMLIIIRIYISM